MPVFKVEINTDKQKCKQCGKMKTGCYKKEGNDYYICTDCILKNIEHRKENK